ncbi:putative Notchless [Dunaliella salina]|uniref:Notchless n=1 Tax=Dunaliella salina TaxID=3046 RepID=A0ABQ7GY11_DUNSA|nr:putative Notchless [Dunaliella salina]|eukprot:KAF5839472.1 putative Notchless [Dunaliella salina]
MSQAKKRKAESQKLEAEANEGNVIIQFTTSTGEATASQLDVPAGITPEQLEMLLNNLLQNDEKLPYSFYIEEQELASSLGSHLHKAGMSVESVLKVVYQPQAIFRVRPVSRCTASMSGHSEAVLSVSFSPDGRHLASGSGDTCVRFWDLGTQLPMHECKGHRSWVLALAWSPDAQYVASGDMDGAIFLWSPKSDKPVGQCSGHSKWITCLSWEPAHKALPSLRFASASKDKTITVWDVSTRRPQFTMSNHTMVVTSVKWGGEGLIYSASRDCSISAWDAKDGKLVRVFKGHAHWVNTLALSTEAVLRTGAFDHRGQAPKDLQEAKDAAAARYKEATGGLPERMASGSDDYTMFLWSPSTSKQHVARMTGHVQTVNQVCFSPDGRLLLSASFDKSVKLWDGVKGTFLATLRAHVGPVYQVAWSSDSRMIVSGSKDSTLKLWDVKTRRLKVDLPGHADEVFCVDWSPDGSSVASGGKDHVIKLWRH